MRIHILSDLHLEFAPFQMNKVDADVTILAGDIHTGRNGIKWIIKTIPHRPVIYVLGNHEYYGQKIPKLASEIKEIAAGSNVHVLDNDKIEIGDITFLGATLWTDYRLDGDAAHSAALAQPGMNDYRRIRVLPTYRRFRTADARHFHAQSLKWLEENIPKEKGQRAVIVTHHAPSPKAFPPKYQNDPLNPASASNLEEFIERHGAALWVHGHIHNHVNFFISKTRICTNPRGYPGESDTGFDPSLVIEI